MPGFPLDGVHVQFAGVAALEPESNGGLKGSKLVLFFLVLPYQIPHIIAGTGVLSLIARQRFFALTPALVADGLVYLRERYLGGKPVMLRAPLSCCANHHVMLRVVAASRNACRTL